jgi:NAD(P)-dependent dehydrogenase (short-subunit alcohol dehydrogenase family)
VSIAGARVLVTGSNRGLGRSLVGALVGRDAGQVFACARDVNLLGFEDPRVVAVQLDVTSDASVAYAASVCAPPLDMVINNAAALFNTPFMGVADLDGARVEMETNYWGILRMCRAFAPLLAPRRGSIVNVLSIGALTSVPFCGSYCASKAAAWSLTQAIRAELREQGVTVAAAFPGPIATDMARPGEQSGRCPPDVMARTLVAALDRGETMIFPDGVSEGFARTYAADPLADRFGGNLK